MKTQNLNKIVTLAIICLSSFSFMGCIDETMPSATLTADQIKRMEASQRSLLNGIVSYMVTYNTWGSSGEYTQDFGYPCQMIFREVQGQDIPVYDGGYNFWSGVEECTDLRYPPYYTYSYYYHLVQTCNALIAVIDPSTASTTSKNYLGVALTYRALAYLDMARMFEFKKTGVTSVDQKADELNCWGLTVPIVTEGMTDAAKKRNPRAPFYTMYRFIMTDLNNAETYLTGYTRTDKTLPDLSVVYGLKARLWLELATRFETTPEDLTTTINADNSATDGYDKLNITSANDCYTKALQYAQQAQSGYTPTTEAQWHDPETGFNKPTDAWMWDMSVSTREQVGTYYSSFPGVLCTEPNWNLPRSFGTYRLIGSALYDQIGLGDWRRYSWIDPAAAGTDAGYTQYATININGKPVKHSLLSKDEWLRLPAYANTKFRPGRGNLDDLYVGLLVDIPLMRMEEMKFIELECKAHLNGISAAATELEAFINTYRYTDNSYSAASISTMDDFNNELLLQKRIEFWGEGITYFDYKRLKAQVRRKDNTNYNSLALFNSKPGGYVAPWMNYFILEYETNINTACVPNPDATGCISPATSF